ncbi:pectin lyase fold protein [Formosa agariphila KMM 3901]|uniref:Pectin lyase fold protein n=1 Tax=Formosa agariphila (strain DSM 15362 / KCTC 12365 / LMG 23005 / KMM 3901 / M-2Alg 35-1) TaxID=1347342 RepID=T2KHI2_FORAG|nr:hypothetical protein [Formosa agariphila]CDF77871.1 pectin lyase fold protein [Formosa agariphila KMM 3901]
MKKLVLNFFKVAGLVSAVAFTSCSSDDPESIGPEQSDVITNLEDGILNGKLQENYSLNAGTQYQLTGSFIIDENAVLNIPAGTKIIAEDGGTDVYIATLRGGTININGTESNPVIMSSLDAEPGDWGGLTLCGNAPTTAGVDASAEVGGFIYGGTNDSDSSGIIRYLQISGTGAQINSESQYNGISFYGVGSGTIVDNIAVINGSDDGVEFFGGTVSVSNLYLENLDDDAIDWTEGWNGSVNKAYISNTISGFSTVFEGDKENGNPKFNNITAISTVGGTALQFKKESGGTITNLSLSGYDVDLDMKDGGATSNVVFSDGYTPVALATEEGDFFYALNTSVVPTVNVDDFSWVDTNVSLESNVLQGAVTGDVTLDASISYTLNSSYIVQDGGKLTIPAGTKITARDGGTGVYIAVLKGGLIDIQGTESNPVVMASVNGEPGDWGGLTICGNATTTAGEDATAEIGGFIYGGNDDADNSGSIKNLVIKGTGAQINSESQYNGVSLYAVGSETVIENIAVINGADDGIEFFGGTVSAKNLYFDNNDDDSVDWTEGWNGTVTNAYITHTKEGFSTVFEGDKDNNNPKFVNITAISTVGGTALQFKKQSGGTITNLYLSGYDLNIDMKDGGDLANVIIDGEAATTTDAYDDGTQVDISTWSWIEAGL